MTSLLVMVIVLSSGASLPAAAAGIPPVRGTEVLSADAMGMTFEIWVPWEEVGLEPVAEGGEAYVRVSIPGWSSTSEAGAPELPFRAEMIGVPFGAVMRVQVEPGRAHTVALQAPVLPVATQVAEWTPPGTDGMPVLPTPSLVVQEDPAVYGGDAAYPGVLAEVAGDGVLRQQRVAGIAVYPAQYDPASGELTVYESLTVSVTFEGGSRALAEAVPAESAIYEELLQGKLLNYEEALGWRRGGASPALDSSGTVPADTEAELETVPWEPPDPGWRLKVREDGFYKLTYDELEGAGLPVSSLDPRSFQLYHLGSEVAIHVVGEDDGTFDGDEGDHIIFYGQALDNKYTADNVYWLTYGQGAGLRMATPSAAPGTAATPANYVAQRHVEESVWYLPGAPGDEHLERWVWNYLYPPYYPSRSYTLPLVAPDVGQPATLTVAMLGGPVDHHVRVLLNGEQVGDVWWDGEIWEILEMAISPGVLVAGDNTVELVAPNDTGVGYDVVYVDWIDLDYMNTFVAEGDELAFGYEGSGTWRFQVSGFGSNGVVVYDVTDPAAVVRLTDIAVTQVGGTYTAEFEDTLGAPVRYWAMADTEYRTVQAIEADTASDLALTANGADHISITHADFMTQTQTLADYRATQGLRAVVVDVQDVYDEFGYGIVGAAPIRDFLAHAYSKWEEPAPSYVVLVGDGNYDPKNYAGPGPVSYIPPYLAPVDPWLGETAADNRYVTLVGDDTMPDMMLGRLAVNSADEATAFVSKIIAYEQTPEAGDWQKQVLAVADNGDGGGDFAKISDDVLDCCVPDTYQETKVHYEVTHTTLAGAQAAILEGINAGKLIVNYIGHASAHKWANEDLFGAADVAGLTNGARLPVMLPMTCYDGYYVHPTPHFGNDATAEVITRAEGKGAVASWSPTGLGVASGHDHLNRGFLEAALINGVSTIGEATQAGKLKLFNTHANLDLLDTYLLFGDPATRLPISPTAVDLFSLTATGTDGAILLNWETATELDNLGFNLYRAESLDGERVKLNADLIPTLVPPGSPFGAEYQYIDDDPALNTQETYYYWLEAVDIYGAAELNGPVSARLEQERGYRIFLPLVVHDR